MESKYCTVCCEMKELGQFKFRDGRIRRHTCKSCMQRKYRIKLKLDMIEALGNVCECCGEANPYFLSLDHRLNDGHKHREKLAAHQCIAEARKEGFPREKYQLLCLNCNFAKGHYGVCPHSFNLTVEQVRDKFKALMGKAGKDRQNYNTEANLSGLEKARAQLKLNRIERGELGKSQAQRSKEYRERHPEAAVRKQEQRKKRDEEQSKLYASLTPEQLLELASRLRIQ